MCNSKDDDCGREATVEELKEMEHLLAKYSMNDNPPPKPKEDTSMGFTYPHER
jgi:hypothetical protein